MSNKIIWFRTIILLDGYNLEAETEEEGEGNVASILLTGIFFAYM
jgi:hypothetical protein